MKRLSAPATVRCGSLILAVACGQSSTSLGPTGGCAFTIEAQTGSTFGGQFSCSVTATWDAGNNRGRIRLAKSSGDQTAASIEMNFVGPPRAKTYSSTEFTGDAFSGIASVQTSAPHDGPGGPMTWSDQFVDGTPAAFAIVVTSIAGGTSGAYVIHGTAQAATLWSTVWNQYPGTVGIRVTF